MTTRIIITRRRWVLLLLMISTLNALPPASASTKCSDLFKGLKEPPRAPSTGAPEAGQEVRPVDKRMAEMIAWQMARRQKEIAARTGADAQAEGTKMVAQLEEAVGPEMILPTKIEATLLKIMTEGKSQAHIDLFRSMSAGVSARRSSYQPFSSKQRWEILDLASSIASLYEARLSDPTIDATMNKLVGDAVTDNYAGQLSRVLNTAVRNRSAGMGARKALSAALKTHSIHVSLEDLGLCKPRA